MQETGVFSEKLEAKGMSEMMASNPDMMQGMMKQQLMGLLPQLALGALVNFFFSGFILGRIPFALSPKFRIMLQRGIDLPGLDPSYFTSLSYYIMLLFGLRGVMMLVFRCGGAGGWVGLGEGRSRGRYRLCLGGALPILQCSGTRALASLPPASAPPPRRRREKAINDAQQMMAMQQQMGGMGGAGGPMGFDAPKAFEAEKAQLSVVRAGGQGLDVVCSSVQVVCSCCGGTVHRRRGLLVESSDELNCLLAEIPSPPLSPPTPLSGGTPLAAGGVRGASGQDASAPAGTQQLSAAAGIIPSLQTEVAAAKACL